VALFGCFIFASMAWVAAVVARVRRHRHTLPISGGAIASTVASLLGAIGISWIAQRDDDAMARAFLTLVVNTGSAFFFGVAAMVTAKWRSQREPRDLSRSGNPIDAGKHCSRDD
jgi:hypothetical protein